LEHGILGVYTIITVLLKQYSYLNELPFEQVAPKKNQVIG